LQAKKSKEGVPAVFLLAHLLTLPAVIRLQKDQDTQSLQTISLHGAGRDTTSIAVCLLDNILFKR